MQIKKINNNKLKVILSLADLDENNVDIDSFLSNSIESQNLFFEILDLAEEQYGFNIEDNKAVVEAISLDNNIFVLTITKLKNDTINNSNLKNIVFFRFENVKDILDFLSFIHLKNIDLQGCSLYQLNKNYYIILNKYNKTLENILIEYSTPLKNSGILKDILTEYGTKLKTLNW